MTAFFYSISFQQTKGKSQQRVHPKSLNIRLGYSCTFFNLLSIFFQLNFELGIILIGSLKFISSK